MKDSIMKGYESLATDVLKDFNNDWIRLIVFNDDESEFNELREFFKSENYEVFCNVCDIKPENWQKFLENLKTRAFADKELHATLQEQWYKQQHNKDLYDDLLMEQQEQM